MLTALLADIHANREAFSACLADAAARDVQRHVFLGDYVGYGAEPGWAVDKVAAHVEAGAVAILGNHDAAVFSDVDMNETARTAGSTTGSASSCAACRSRWRRATACSCMRAPGSRPAGTM